MSIPPAINPADARPAGAPPPTPLTPEERVLARADRMGLSVQLTDSSGTVRTLTGADLRALSTPAGRARLHDEFGVDANDFFAALGQACDRNVQGQTVDLTRANAANAALYNNVDGDMAARPARTFDGTARVETGVSENLDQPGTFNVSGEATHTRNTDFWRFLLDLLIEIFTLSIARTWTFNGGMGDDQRTEARQHVGAIAMAGGSAMRHQIMGMTPAESQARFAEIIRRANPQLTNDQVTELAHFYDTELRAVYADPAITGTPPSDAEADRRLNILVQAYDQAGLRAFRNDPGQWLQEHLHPPSGRSAAETLSRDLRRASSASEVSAALVFAAPNFTNLDPPTQATLAQQLFSVRHHPEAGAAYTGLIQNSAFAGLDAGVRRDLLAALDRQHSDPARVRELTAILPALSGQSLAVQQRAADVLRDVPPGSAAFSSLTAMIGSPEFARMPEAARLDILTRVRAGGFNDAQVRGLRLLIASDNFNRALTNDPAVATAALDAMGAATTQAGRDAVVTLMNNADFARQPAAVRQRVFTALGAAGSAAARDNLVALATSPGFAALTQANQEALLQRFASGGQAVRDAFGSVTETLNAMGTTVDGHFTARLSPEAAGDVVSALTSASAADLPARSRALARLLPSLGAANLSGPEQRRVLTILANGGFSETRAGLLASLVSHQGFIGMPAPARATILQRLANADAAHFADAYRTALTESNAALVHARGPEFGGRLEALMALPAYNAPQANGAALTGDAQLQAQAALLAFASRTPPLGEAEFAAVTTLVNSPAYNQLSPAHQRQMLEHVAAHPAGATALTQLLEGYAATPASQRDHYMALVARVDLGDAQAVARFRAIVSAPAYARLTDAAREQLFTGLESDGPAFATRMAERMPSAAFNALSGPDQRAEILAERARARLVTPPAQAAALDHLLTDARFTALPAAARANILEHLVAASGDNTAAIDSLRHILDSAAFGALSAADQARLATALGNSLDARVIAGVERVLNATGSANIGQVVGSVERIINAPAFANIPGNDLLRTIASHSDPAVIAGFEALITSPTFASLPPATQAVVMRQAMNYPNADSLRYLERMTGAAWFRSMSIADQQRASKVIGYDASTIAGATNAEQRTILVNTLDQFMPPNGTFRMTFEPLEAPPGSITFGEALGSVFTLNSDLIPADDNRLEAAPNSHWAIEAATDTMAHEVNHLMNTDEVHETYDYFQGEYRAWYVGFIAQNGRPPNANECYRRAVYLLTQPEGAYGYITRARLSTTNGHPSAEAQRIIAFMNQFFPTPFDLNDPASANAIVNLSGSVTVNFPAGGPRPDPIGNMTNGGRPVVTRGGGLDARPN